MKALLAWVIFIALLHKSIYCIMFLFVLSSSLNLLTILVIYCFLNFWTFDCYYWLALVLNLFKPFHVVVRDIITLLAFFLFSSYSKYNRCFHLPTQFHCHFFNASVHFNFFWRSIKKREDRVNVSAGHSPHVGNWKWETQPNFQKVANPRTTCRLSGAVLVGSWT